MSIEQAMRKVLYTISTKKVPKFYSLKSWRHIALFNGQGLETSISYFQYVSHLSPGTFRRPCERKVIQFKHFIFARFILGEIGSAQTAYKRRNGHELIGFLF